MSPSGSQLFTTTNQPLPRRSITPAFTDRPSGLERGDLVQWPFVGICCSAASSPLAGVLLPRVAASARQQWQSAAKAWDRWSPLLRAWLGPATGVMLDMAAIGPGCHVLDVAAGAGDQSLRTAERVGPSGRVLATDISANILEFAAENAQVAGHNNIATSVMDGEALDVPESTFDAVISRVGLIYFPNQQKALAEMKRTLKPGGRVAASVYITAENNKFFSLPVSIIRRRAALPAPQPGQPGPLSLGGPGVLEGEFRKAGFSQVRSCTVAAPVELKSAAECVRFEKESFGALRQMLAPPDQTGKDSAWKEIEEELRQFEGPTGFRGPCEMIVAAVHEIGRRLDHPTPYIESLLGLARLFGRVRGLYPTG